MIVVEVKVSFSVLLTDTSWVISRKLFAWTPFFSQVASISNAPKAAYNTYDT
jgi:hypothetical protein